MRALLPLFMITAACTTDDQPNITVNVPPDEPDQITVEAPVVNEGDDADITVNVPPDGGDGQPCSFEVEYYLGGTRVLPTRPFMEVHSSTAPYGALDDGEVYTVAITAPAGCGDIQVNGFANLVTTVGDNGWFGHMVDHTAQVLIGIEDDVVGTTYGPDGDANVIVNPWFLNYYVQPFVVPDGATALMTLVIDNEFEAGMGPDIGQMFRAEVGPQVAFSWGPDFESHIIIDITGEEPIVGNWRWVE